jgi:hypothetical protein
VFYFGRQDDSIVAKMNVMFDKAAYEKGRSLKPEENPSSKDMNDNEGRVVERAIRDSIAAGKVGSLTVDPNYLDFVPLECKYTFSRTSVKFFHTFAPLNCRS